MKRFVSLILSVCFLFSINTVSYAANISSRKASNPVIQSMNDKYHVDFSGMSIDELNKFIDKMKDEDQTRASGNLLNNTQLAWLAAAQIARDKGYECAALMVEFSVYNIDYKSGECSGQCIRVLPAHTDSKRTLWVSVHKQNFLALHCKPYAQIFTGGGFARAAFLVDNDYRCCLFGNFHHLRAAKSWLTLF